MKRVFRATLFIMFIVGLFYTAPYYAYNMGLYNIGIDLAMIDIILKIFVVILPMIAYIYIFRKDINVSECLKLKGLGFKQILILISIGFFIQPFAMLISGITNMFVENVAVDYMKEFANTPLWLMVFSLAIIPAVTEELMMRGIVFYESRDISLAVAAVLNGTLFGILHRNLSQFFYAFALGMVFVYIVNITHSIYSTMIVHFIINASQVYAMRLITPENTGTAAMDITILDKIATIGLAACICLICLPVVNWLFRKLKKISIREIEI